MSYLALYRKYRSKTFDEIIGQEHVTTTLKNQITNDKIAHAYLFCGIRGTGKTSIAKILGKAVNCVNSKDGNPCLVCEMCKGIDDNSLLNVIEIDAASNNGVENVKEIRNDVMYTPSEGKYKVYIIDEVHMLSISAFNALLKILEEPPKHVIFILATTEFQKIPATILSRCQRFDLKRIAKDLMIERLKEYITIEKTQVDDRAISYISSLAEGSMRDALSILEQVMSIKNGESITLDDVLNTLGNVDYSVYNDFTIALKTKDVSRAIEIVNQIYEDGKEIRNFVMQYISYLRNILLIMNSSNAVNIVDMSEENVARIKKLSEELSNKDIVRYIEEFTKVEVEIKYASMPKLLVEVLIVKLTNIPVEQGVTIDSARVVQVPVYDINNLPASITGKKELKEPKEQPKEIQCNKKNVVIKGDEEAANIWNEVIRKTQPPLKSFLLNSRGIKANNETFYVRMGDEFAKNQAEKNKKMLEDLLPIINDKKLSIVFYLEEELEKQMNKSNENEQTKVNDLLTSLQASGVNMNVN